MYAFHCHQSLQLTSKKTKSFVSIRSKGHVRALRVADSDPLCWFLYFCGQPVVALIMIDSSKIRKTLVGVEVQSLYVIERCSKSRKRK